MHAIDEHGKNVRVLLNAVVVLLFFVDHLFMQDTSPRKYRTIPSCVRTLESDVAIVRLLGRIFRALYRFEQIVPRASFV